MNVGSKAPTVASDFKRKLSELISTLSVCDYNFVRCIKPNSSESSDSFDKEMVANQLRCAGVLEAISVSRAGYPIRMPFADFASAFAARYRGGVCSRGAPA